jgi:hypothetical protein
MSHPQAVTLTLDRRLLEHPQAHHLRRMRIGLWLYLDLLARLPAGTGTIEVEPTSVAREMGLPEGTIRSWLGHLRKAGYLEAVRLNGIIRVTLKGDELPAPPVQIPTSGRRTFTAAKLAKALGESDQKEALQAALSLYPDAAIRRALAGALGVPESQIRRSRTALFLYLVKRYANET